MDVFQYASGKKDYDLIVVDYPLMDRYGHSFQRLLEDGDHSDVQQRFQQHFRAAYNRMDTDFTTLLQFAERQGYQLLIASGHGFSPIHTSINLNKLITEQGINATSDSIAWEARGFPGKVSGHIYLNPSLNKEEKKEIGDRLVKLFETLKDPGSGASVVEKVYTKQTLPDIGMNHPRAGDLFVLLRSGYVFQRAFFSDQPVFDVPVFKGDHGYSLAHKSSFGVFIGQEVCNQCATTDIANIVLESLGVPQ